MASTLRQRGADTGSSLRRRLPRPILLTAVGLLGVLLVAAALLVGLRLARSGALPGVTVGGADVGGLAGEDLRAAITEAGSGDAVVTVTFRSEEVSATGAEMGYTLDVAATEQAVLRRGRQGNPVAALVDHVRAFGSRQVEVAITHDVDQTALERWAASVAGALDRPPVEGTLQFGDAAFERIEPADGIRIDTGAVAEQGQAALLEGGETTFEAPGETEPAETTTEALDDVALLAERALAAPVVLRRGDGTLTVTPQQIAGLLSVEQDGDELSLAIDTSGVGALAGGDVRAAFESDPVDARIELAGDSVRITESIDGFRFDEDVAAGQLLEVATGEGAREAELAGEIIEPARSTADAEALEIVEPVSAFTTHFQCCQSRVTNIHRIADLVDGVIIEPGETFSVNGHVGPRTTEKRFVGGGAILDGEFVEQIGGGVSQFATTMYNAAFFGGYEIPDYKPHSYYISRYPIGREATLNYPDVDLKVHNNSPYGILVQTSHTSTSITVTFWGKEWVEVGDITGQPTNFRQPPLVERENPDLPPGASRTVQSGREGFDITVTRILAFPGGREEREQIFTRYLAEPRIVERNSAPPPEPDPEPTEEPDPDPDPGDGDGDGEGGGGGD
jgi:vancomycin resistance protein YoaR